MIWHCDVGKKFSFCKCMTKLTLCVYDIYVWTRMYTCVHVHRGQRSALDVFFNGCPCFLILVSHAAHWFRRLAPVGIISLENTGKCKIVSIKILNNQKSPGILLSLPLKSCDCRYTAVPGFYVGDGDLDSGPHACMADTFIVWAISPAPGEKVLVQSQIAIFYQRTIVDWPLVFWSITITETSWFTNNGLSSAGFCRPIALEGLWLVKAFPLCHPTVEGRKV